MKSPSERRRLPSGGTKDLTGEPAALVEPHTCQYTDLNYVIKNNKLNVKLNTHVYFMTYTFVAYLLQESPADAKISALQQCVCEGPLRRNPQHINDMRMRFLLMAKSIRGRITYRL